MGGGEPKLPLLQPRHSVWHLGVQSWTAVKSDRLSAPGEADKRSWMMAFSGRRKGIPIVKAKSRRHSYREIQKVLMCCVRKGGNLKCKSHPLVLGLPPALLYYLKMVAYIVRWKCWNSKFSATVDEGVSPKARRPKPKLIKLEFGWQDSDISIL